MIYNAQQSWSGNYLQFNDSVHVVERIIYRDIYRARSHSQQFSDSFLTNFWLAPLIWGKCPPTCCACLRPT